MPETEKTENFSAANSNLPLIIVNPKSAAGATRGRWASMASDIRAHFGAFQVAFTKRAGDGFDLAKRAAETGRKFIIACGGDGTINEVANGILESGDDKIELGVIPSGTGGDFRRSLGFSTDARENARLLRDGVTKTIDVGKVTFENHGGEKTSRYFLNVASFGLSAAIINRVKTNPAMEWMPFDALRGKAGFAVSTLQEIFDLNFKTVLVKIDDKPATNLNTVNFCVCNARYFGGGMKIAPDAKLSDGKLDLINIGDIKTARILLNAHTLYRGTHLDLTEVKSTLAEKITIAPTDKNQTINLEIDGELPGRLPAVFEIVPKALKIRLPRR